MAALSVTPLSVLTQRGTTFPKHSWTASRRQQLPLLRRSPDPRGDAVSASASAGGLVTTKEGITVNSTPSDEEVATCKTWSTWGCEASTFPWTYGAAETCYLLEGEVTVTPEGGGEPASFKAGDVVSFPAGMSCTWDVHVAVKKHFKFH